MPATPVTVSQIKSSAKVDSDQQVERLRALLLGPEANQVINRLVEKDQASLVAEVISEALEKRAQQDNSLAQSLSPLVDNAIDTSIKDHPDRITNVIFPVMGPAIRKAVAVALQEMVQNLNQILSEGLSFRSWRWRIQAWHAGKPYAEFVLIKTLQYRVEQVLLIHRDTGLLMQEASIPTPAHEDPELVSAMLTAINDFACDSFHKDRQLCIDSIRFGDYTLTIVAGPFALLVGAIRGTPAPEIGTKLSEVIENIHLNYASPLMNFNGDKHALEPIQNLLKDCLLQKAAAPRRSAPWLAYGLLSLALCGLGTWAFNTYQVYSRQQQVIAALAQQGILVLDQSSRGQNWNLVTLRPETAPYPQDIIDQSAFEEWNITFDDRVIPKIEEKLPVVVPSHQQLASSQWQQTVADLQTTRLHFQPASKQLVPEDNAALARMVTKSRSLAALAEPAGISDYQLILTGFADSSGSESTNLQLSRERAQVVYDHLQANGIAAETILLWGLGTLGSSRFKSGDQRVVSMQVFYKLTSTNEDKL